MAQITYDDKVALNTNPNVAEINKVTDNNMNEIKNAVNTNTPVGSISLFAGTTAPNGWLICDGSAVSRTTYANLFSVIGTTYGTGDGSTTFNIPNLKGKVPVGLDSSDTSFDTIGETGGEKTHTLTNNELPRITGSFSTSDNVLVNSLPSPTISEATGAFTRGSRHQTQVDATGVHQATDQGVYNKINMSFGNDQAHNNLQPYIVMNYIISY